MRSLILIVLAALALAGTTQASSVGDGGGTGWMNGIQCSANHAGWVTWYQGRRYRCSYNANYTIKWAWVLA